MVGGDGQRGVVAQQADDVQVGHAGLHHHDVGALRLVQARLPQRLPVVARVLLVRLLVGGDDAGALPCAQRGCDTRTPVPGRDPFRLVKAAPTGREFVVQGSGPFVGPMGVKASMKCSTAHACCYSAEHPWQRLAGRGAATLKV